MTDYGLASLVVAGVPETILLLLPYWFIPPRFRATIFIVLGWSAIWFTANILYFRNFGDVLSVEAIEMTENLNGFVVDSAIHSFRIVDLIFFLPTCLLIIVYALYFRRSVTAKDSTFGRLTKLYALTISIIIIVLWQGFLLYRDYREEVSPLEHLTDFTRVKRSGIIRSYGYIHYMLLDIYHTIRSPYIPLGDDRLKIEHYIKSRYTAAKSDDESCRHTPPNLILIIVESLNSDAITIEYSGKQIAPHLQRLLADSSVFRALNVKQMAGIGRSSDGQFIYNTGLLPTTDRVTAFTYGNADYPSIAKALGINAEEIIGEGRALWNHASTSRSYGYNHLHDITELPDYRKSESDSMIFNRAIAYVDSVKTPFMLEITTLSMHQPYLENDYPAGEIRDAIGNNERAYYLESVNYFDRQLNRFINHLDQAGILESCVIALASDHIAPLQLTTGATAYDLTFILLNGPKGGTANGEILQTDLYPTLLYAMGRTDYFWQGVGRNLFIESSKATPVDSARHISDLIIKGGFFR
ncbi:MAG: LTA synthase family protein [Lachnoclostridium sp.]|nr:LTA synthase family protein [Lachnoclostridium sp.]